MRKREYNVEIIIQSRLLRLLLLAGGYAAQIPRSVSFQAVHIKFYGAYCKPPYILRLRKTAVIADGH